MTAVVVDTNVLVVANGQTPQASRACVETCEDALLDAPNSVIVIDTAGLILEEYSRHASRAGRPGVGDFFLKWLHENQARPEHCERVEVTPLDSQGTEFAEFPDDRALRGFDRSDRKFVAVAIASRHDPSVLNATDTDWCEYREALLAHGVTVRFLCPDAVPCD